MDSSMVERRPDKTEVHGPIPCPPTIFGKVECHPLDCARTHKLGAY